jgi:hypothetical protein
LTDPAAETDLRALDPFPARLRSTLAAPWSATTILSATGPARFGTPSTIYDERPLRLRALSLPSESMNPAPAGVGMSSRLRLLHERQIRDRRFPIAADWYVLAGRPAVLDRFSYGPADPMGAFALTAELDPELGLAVFGEAPTTRSDSLLSVGVPVASTASFDGVLRWSTPPDWHREETLILTTPNLSASAATEPLFHRTAEDWTQQVFARAPFLRDVQTHGDRDVAIPGVDGAHLWRFDWQPSGMGRQLTTVVTGTLDEARYGFSFIFEVPLVTTFDHVFLADPDEILAGVHVA